MNGTSMMNGMKFFSVIALSLLFAAGCAPEGDEVESLPVPLTFSPQNGLRFFLWVSLSTTGT